MGRISFYTFKAAWVTFLAVGLAEASQASPNYQIVNSEAKMDAGVVFNKILVADIKRQAYVSCFFKHGIYDSKVTASGCATLKTAGDFTGDWGDAQFASLYDATYSDKAQRRVAIRLDQSTGKLSLCLVEVNPAPCFVVDVSSASN